MPKRPRLTVERRTVLGKKVKRLRRVGLIPGNVVETHKPSIAIQIPERELAALVRQGGGGHLVDVAWDGDSQPMLADLVELDPITNRLVHATLRRVDLTKALTVAVPVHLEGTAPASQSAELSVIQMLNEIDVSALPAEIPSRLIATAERLAEAGDEIRVEDLQAADGAYEPVTDPSATVAVVNYARQALAEEAEEAAALELEALAAEAPAEGETPEEAAAGEAEPGQEQS